jgi:hypothetical protein
MYFNLKTMDEHTYNNWVKVKETFESSGNTDNFFYQRACVIVSGGPDPIDNMIKQEQVLSACVWGGLSYVYLLRAFSD